MSESFNPYYTWLGIPLDKQPADFYQLLGISQFEQDADVISNAADQRMLHVRTFQSGKHSQLSQKILNELAAARLCLLDPVKKEAYDAKLRGPSRRNSGSLQIAVPMSAPSPAPTLSPAPAEPKPSGPPKLSSQPAKSGGTGLILLLLGGAAAAFLLLCTAGLAVYFMLPSSPEVVDGPDGSGGSDGGTGLVTVSNGNNQNAGGKEFTFDNVTYAAISSDNPLTQRVTSINLKVPIESQNEKALVTNPKGSCVARVDFDPAQNYVIEFTATRLSNDESLTIGMPIHDGNLRRTALMVFDGFGNVGYRTGINVLEGHYLDSANYPEPLHRGPLLKNDTAHKFQLVALEGKLIAHLDGKEVYRWEGNSNALRSNPRVFIASPTHDKLYFATWFSKYKIENCTVYGIRKKSGSTVAGGTDSVKQPLATSVAVGSENFKLRYVGDPLAKVNDQDSRLMGTFRKEGESVITAAHGNVAVRIPVDPPEEFVLDCTLEVPSANQPVGIAVPISGPEGRHMARMMFNAYGKLSGIAALDRMTIMSPRYPGEKFDGKVFESNKKHAVRLVVLRGEMFTYLDGKELFHWKGPTSQLTNNPPFPIPDPSSDKLFLTSVQTETRFGDMRLYEIVRDGQVATNSPTGSPTKQDPKLGVDTANYDIKTALLPLENLRINSSTVEKGDIVKLNKDTLQSRGTGQSVLRIDWNPPNEYLLDVRATRLKDDGALCLHFPVDGKEGRSTATVVFQAHPANGYYSGLQFLDGKFMFDRDYGGEVHRGEVLKLNEPADIRIVVLKNEVIAYLNGEKLSAWKGPTTQLQGKKGVFDPDPSHQKIYITTWDTEYRLEGLRVTPLLPKGTQIASVPQDPMDPRDPMNNVDPVKPVPEEPSRIAVPEGDAHDNALAEIEQIFSKEIAAANLPTEKAALAKQLFTVGKDTKDDTSRYVLMELAMKMAAEGADLKLALQLARTLFEEYEIAALVGEQEAVKVAADAATTQTQRMEIAAEAMQVSKDAAAAEAFEIAENLADIAVATAVKVRSLPIRNETRQWRDQLEQDAKLWKDAEAARKAIVEDDANADAHLTLGRYLCFVKGDFIQGVPHLAKGSDADLSAIAKLDEGRPDTPDEQLAVADGWWDLAEKRSEDEIACKRRSAAWYKECRGSVSPLLRVRVDRRLAQAEDDVPGGISDVVAPYSSAAVARPGSNTSSNTGSSTSSSSGPRTPASLGGAFPITTWKHSGGYYQKEGDNWVEYSSGRKVWEYREIENNGSRVVMVCTRRGVIVMLDEDVAKWNPPGNMDFSRTGTAYTRDKSQ